VNRIVLLVVFLVITLVIDPLHLSHNANAVDNSSREAFKPVAFVGTPAPVGDGIEITSIEFFEPFFARGRNGDDSAVDKRTNPEMPSHTRSKIQFESAGVYYLVLNGTQFRKFIVLDRSLSDPENLKIIFTFMVQDVIVNSTEDELVGEDAAKFLRENAMRKRPMLILCGPTLHLLRFLVEKNLGLPTRSVSYPGWHFSDGRLQASTHNALEVQIEGSGWWLLDPNNAFLTEMSAVEFSNLIYDANGGLDVLSRSRGTESEDRIFEIYRKANAATVEAFSSIDAGRDMTHGAVPSSLVDFGLPRGGDVVLRNTWPMYLMGVRYARSELTSLLSQGVELDLPGVPDFALSTAGEDLIVVINERNQLVEAANDKWHEYWSLTNAYFLNAYTQDAPMDLHELK